jgi:hypothetical protein
MWLLDANMDVHLLEVLRGCGIACDTAGNRGWKALSNAISSERPQAQVSTVY